jgi:hypothetical protein
MVNSTTPAPERARLVAELEQLYAEGKHAEILAQVDACLPKLEKATLSPIRKNRMWCTTCWPSWQIECW